MDQNEQFDFDGIFIRCLREIPKKTLKLDSGPAINLFCKRFGFTKSEIKPMIKRLYEAKRVFLWTSRWGSYCSLVDPEKISSNQGGFSKKFDSDFSEGPLRAELDSNDSTEGNVNLRGTEAPSSRKSGNGEASANDTENR